MATGKGRRLAFFAGFILSALFFFAGLGATPAFAQGISLLRDTETEDMLKSYETPLAKAAGLDPVPRVWLIGSPDINAFASYGDGGENIFIMSGILLDVKVPNELIGVMAHETGHIAAGHLSRTNVGMQHAMVPMLLSLVLGAAAMALGAGDAGIAIIGAGAAIAQGQMAAFTRVQESTADQIALKLLAATHQSPMGIYRTFERFAIEQAQSAYKIDKFAVDHPVGQDRLADIETKVNASPWRDVKDPPQVTHTFEMVQAKLAGFTLPVAQALEHYPESNTSEPARYARAMAYLRKPDLQKALSTTNSLIQDEPNNPFFYEVLGQIYVSMAKPMQAIPSYQRAVDLRPNAPQLRLGLAVAQLATEDARLAGAALQNLKAASLIEDDDVFTWYETAQAYSLLKNEPMANLSTAEAYYNAGSLRQAGIFAIRARRGLEQGGADWQRANDIVGVASTPQR
ncbi:MAG TPA: M48 family metalloprotease [Rhizomicrobium sp.]|jgi:predicted Zn-dependent protease